MTRLDVGLLALLFVVASGCGDGGHEGPKPLEPNAAVRRSSLQDCQGLCDYGEFCDSTRFDDPFCVDPSCGVQTGDLRCHRVCEDDGRCAPHESCTSRPVFVSDTPTIFLDLCTCADAECQPPPPIADEGGVADFRDEQPLPIDLYYHAASAGSGYLFTSGGLTITDLQFGSATLARVRQVFGARIGSQGRLEGWKQVGTLPEPLLNHASVVVESRLYVLGGEQESHGETETIPFSARTWSAAIDSHGQVGAFRAERPLPAGRAWHAAFVDGHRLIVAGGSIEAGFSTGTDQVWLAEVDADGSIGAFSTIRAPERLNYDGGSVTGVGRLYVVGESGAIYSVPLDSIEAATWRKETERPRRSEGKTFPFGTSSSFPPSSLRGVLLGDALVYIWLGGVTASAPVGADGNVGEFRAAARIQDAVQGFSGTVAGGRFYVAGGTEVFVPIRRVDRVYSTVRR